MIKFEDEKYGKVIIYELSDVPEQHFKLNVELINLYFEELKEKKLINIIGYRNLETRVVKLLKNRFGPIEDSKTEQFVLNYKEKEYTKFTRFEIMEI